ncbi:MAG: LD-carboxypeptidase [Bacteroidales bacterium]|nr:LD-carboxypeptidase [Bacteroidales bacterium]
MNAPPHLRPTDHVAIVATARSVEPAEMAPAIELLTSWGLHVEIPAGLYATEGQLAGSDAHRAELLQQAIDSPHLKALFFARGGYGTARIIDRVDFSPLHQHPKWLIGYSDITVVHSHLHRHLALPTLHATMPINIPSHPDPHCPALQSLHDYLFRGHCYIAIPSHPFSRPGQAIAPVVGGNLSILYSLCGSPSTIDTTGKILLLEDLDEYLYHLDRMMLNLRRNGMLQGLAGLIVGGLTDMRDNAVPFGRSAEQIVAEAVAPYSFPVAFGVPIGHLGLRNHALPLGTPVSLHVEPSGAAAINAL